MALIQLSEPNERLVKKQLLEYVRNRALNGRTSFEHCFDSTWEHACRFLWHFDPPEDTSFQGYKPSKSIAQMLEVIDGDASGDIPCIQAFLDTALCLNTHFYGCSCALTDPMLVDPDLEPILVSLELIDSSGLPSREFLLHALGRGGFCDDKTGQYAEGVNALLRETAVQLVQTASSEDKDYIHSNIGSKPHALANWFSSKWHFGAWLSEEIWNRDSIFLGSHCAFGWLIHPKVKELLAE